MVRALGIKVRGDGSNALSILLPNRSRVTDGFYKSLRPQLATTNGTLWLLSTPCEKRGFFYEAWEHGGDTWERVRVQATECERIHPDFLEEERRELGQAWFRQEYMAVYGYRSGFVRAGSGDGGADGFAGAGGHGFCQTALTATAV